MSTSPSFVVEHDGSLRAIMRIVEDFGFRCFDLVGLPRRLVGEEKGPPLLEANVDARRVTAGRSPASLLPMTPEDGSWPTASRHSIARLAAAFLIGEDPQRRLDVHKAATLMHQVSLVQHLTTSDNLRKALIGDEVGLGKTIEAGLFLRILYEQRPSLRVLYLAPARLVGNVVWEFREKLDLDARRWTAGTTGDARLESDKLVVASINKAVFGDNFDRVVSSGPWDVLIVDECHHLSDWDPDGGSPNQAFRLVQELMENMPADGRVLLLSGTPHQGSEARFRNLLRLLSDDGNDIRTASGRVIFRTKDRVRDWRGRPLFPSRDIRPPTVVQLGPAYERWYQGVGRLYDRRSGASNAARATGWAKGQALQWAASSVQAGLGFLARLGIRRLDWTLRDRALAAALAALRPYRGGAVDESLQSLYERILRQIGTQKVVGDVLADSEEDEEDIWHPDPVLLSSLIDEAIALLATEAANAKWHAVRRIIDATAGEKVVLFAQPVETVAVVAAFLERQYGQKPAVIIGNQQEDERKAQVDAFQSPTGPRFLVSSRAGGEGLNMQRARRLIHLDVPWNPMELEQRVGRIHRFGSRRTVIVDTVVAAGSREMDMYRIAREKLALIVSHLDPEQFESLFSRVMSLVPPRELEEILGGTLAGPIPTSAADEIGRLVTDGYRSWSEFDAKYRQQADQIRAVSPGEATWSDLAQFLLKFGSAAAGPDVNITAFDFRDEEIVAVDEQLPAIRIDDRLFACGDTGGLQPEPLDGQSVQPLGLNLPEILGQVSKAFASDGACGAAYLRRPAELNQLAGVTGPIGLLAFLRQTIRQEHGTAIELANDLSIYALAADGSAMRLEAPDRARAVRACVGAVRLRDPIPSDVARRMPVLESEIAMELRKPTSEEIDQGVRHVVWPIAAIVLA